ncbi:MAG: tRNA (adenosine(37)-N6)-threonylcarbamoyltransferase complex transferase subunit TsaD, partial [Bacteroidota bacterium]
MSENPLILAIESSCDETAAAVLEGSHVRANIISTQLAHQKYGGVIPELASRLHQQAIVEVVEAALKEADIQPEQLEAVAYTRGPGLLGALLVGTSFAKAYAFGLDIPLLDVNHMQAHILANFLRPDPPSFPFLCLTVSGGHTQLVFVKDYLDMEVLGETIDDAVGEAFDKGAKLLGLPYPGGPQVDKWAQKGDPTRFSFAKPSVGDLEFSFSGIKTSLLYFLRKELQKNPDFIEENIADICASYQSVLVEILLDKLTKAVKETGATDIAIAGGVSANSELRRRFQAL